MCTDIQTHYRIRAMLPEDNPYVAVLIRDNLKKHGLDIPGTVYFDAVLDKLYEFYSDGEGRGYYVLTDKNNHIVGGIGFDKFGAFENCAELQKLYLADDVKGMGLGYRLISFIEDKMREAGYKASYLETHSNLKAAMHIYEKCGYAKIERPKEIVHGAMDNFYYKSL